MSGGHFAYNQFILNDIAEEIDHLIKINNSNEVDEWGDKIGYNYPDDIIEKFKQTSNELKRCSKMVHRIDWLISGDDGIECFRKRWIEDQIDETW